MKVWWAMDSSDARDSTHAAVSDAPGPAARSDDPESVGRNWIREALIAAALIVGTVGLLWRARSQASAIQRIETAPVLAAEQTYRQEFAPTIRWGARGPDFAAVDASGSRFRLSNLRAKASMLALGFIGGHSTGNVAMVGDLLDLLTRYRARGFEAVIVIERGAEKEAPAWLLHRLGCPIVTDPDGSIGRSYGLTQIPMTVLMSGGGTVKAVEGGFHQEQGASYLHQELDERFTGHRSLPRYESLPLSVGDRFPNFLAQYASGQPFELDDLAGRWRLLAFSYEGCHACGGLSDRIHSQIEDLRGRGGVTIWMEITENLSAQSAAAVPGILDTFDTLFAARHIMARERVPSLFLLDAEGRIVLAVRPPLKNDSLVQLATRIQSIRAR